MADKIWTLSSEERKLISDALTKRKALLPCPRCHGESFILFQNLCQVPFSQKQDQFALDQFILSVVLVCNNCGFMSHHLLSRLNLGLDSDGKLTNIERKEPKGDENVKS